ncbi:zinc finger protein 532-like [Pollicipes pollicipes]|uniref:zinc finger protein 532-like n=1 Tax=Pollicipes pollicipes TaxID=41117 RepID=UPI0018859857|nr:zinc finger protein 532-like [Pollicipes pollicipes]
MLGMLLASPCPSSSIAQAPDHLQLPLPRDGFMCDQCGDRFVLPSSLEQHHGRRSLRVTLSCPECRQPVVFANKCQLLEHLDSHKIDPVSLDPSLIDAAALSSAELGCLPEPARTEPLPAKPAATAGAAAAAAKQSVKPRVNKVNRPVHVSCPMCNVLCSTVTLSEHLCPPPEPEATPLAGPPPRCPDCDQPCPSQCALMAHQGLHKPDLWPYPYVCPECGLKLLGTLDQCLRHVVAGCLHLTRDLKACCALCRMEVADAKAHMLQEHVQKLYKCRRCPLAFESTHGFNGHLVDKHGGVVVAGETPFMLILKCPFCAATFNNANALRDHMGSRKHGDRALQQVSFVFRCPECDSDFTRKQELVGHLAELHPAFKLLSMVVPPRPPVTHTCAVCKEEFRRKPEYTEHGRVHLRDGVPLCLLCNTRFASNDMLKNHLADHASEIGRDRCGLCYAKLGSRDTLQFHLEGEHGLRCFTCARCDLQFDRLIDLNRHNFAKHRGSRGEQIASFVAGGGRGAQFEVEEEPEEGEEVIELEMKEGEITQKREAVEEAAQVTEYIMPDLDGFGVPEAQD